MQRYDVSHSFLRQRDLARDGLSFNVQLVLINSHEILNVLPIREFLLHNFVGDNAPEISRLLKEPQQDRIELPNYESRRARRLLDPQQFTNRFIVNHVKSFSNLLFLDRFLACCPDRSPLTLLQR